MSGRDSSMRVGKTSMRLIGRLISDVIIPRLFCLGVLIIKIYTSLIFVLSAGSLLQTL